MDQPCSQFVVHPELEVVQRLYNEGDLAFFANAGVHNRPVDKDNYYERPKTLLFGHDTMQTEAQNVDPFDGASGTGILGRMCDVLERIKYTPQPLTVQDATIATVGVPGASVDPLNVSPHETKHFNPTTQGETFDPMPYLKQLNDATMLQSSLYREMWSQCLQKALFDDQAIMKAMTDMTLVNTFPDTEYASKLKAVATLIATNDLRGTDRNVYTSS